MSTGVLYLLPKEKKRLLSLGRKRDTSLTQILFFVIIGLQRKEEGKTMQDLIEQCNQSPDLECVWRIPFRRNCFVSMKFAVSYVSQILQGEGWAAGTLQEMFFSDHVGETDLPREQEKRNHIYYEKTMYPLFDKESTVYVIRGCEPFRYITIEYTEEGIGILTDYQNKRQR